MTVVYPIVALAEGEQLDPDWIADITEAANDHETRVDTLETFSRVFVRKTADESVTSSTTVQNDDHLFLAVAANIVYVLDAWLVTFCSVDTTDFKMGFTLPSGATLSFSANGLKFNTTGDVHGLIQQQALINQSSPTATQVAGTVGDNTVVNVRGLLTVGSTAGNLQLQWAQFASVATAVTLKAGSWMRLEKVS